MNAIQFAAVKTEQIARLASKGRAWIEAEGKAVRAAMGRQRIEGRRDGTYASLEGQLENLRAAWRLAV